MTTANRKYTSEESREIAATILSQLGGNKFVAMTGAKDLSFGNGSLQFKIGKNGSKANIVVIELNGLDLYTMKFFSLRKMELKELEAFENLYDNMLQKIFTDYTGLYTSL